MGVRSASRYSARNSAGQPTSGSRTAARPRAIRRCCSQSMPCQMGIRMTKFMKMAFIGTNPSGRLSRPAYIIRNCSSPMPAEIRQIRQKYARRSWVWAKPSTVQKRNSGADSRPSWVNSSGTQPVKEKK